MIRRRASTLSRPPTSDLAEREKHRSGSGRRTKAPSLLPFPMVFCRDWEPPPCNSQASGRGFPSHHHPAQSTASTHQIKFWPPYPVAVQGLCLCFLHAATNSILLPHGSGVGMPELLTRTSHFLSSKRCGRQIGRDLRAIVVRVAAWGGMIRLHAVFSPPRATEPINVPTNEPLRSSNARPHRARRSRTLLGRMAAAAIGRLSLHDRLLPCHSSLPPVRAC